MIKKLKDICKFLSGYNWKSSKFSDEGIPIIRIGNLNTTHSNFKYWNDSYDKKYIIKHGDILVSLSGTIKVAKWIGKNALLNQRIVKITAKENINVDWVFYQIKYAIEQIEAKAKQATIKNVSINDLKKIEVEVPDLETQNKIVAVLDKASNLIEKRKGSIELLDDLIETQYFKIFGEPYENTKKWKTKPLNDIVKNIKTGWSIGGERRLKQDDEYGVLMVSAVTTGEFKPNEYKAIPKEKITRDIITVQKGDLLFSRANTLKYVAATCIVEEDYPKLFLPDKLWKIIVDKKQITPEYLKLTLSSVTFNENLSRSATGSSSSMLNISKRKLKETIIPVPPLEKQKELSTIYWKIRGMKSKKRKSLEYIETLFNSILQRAFNGQLNFDHNLELNSLLNKIDLEAKENDLSSIKNDDTYFQLLIDRLNNQKFETIDLYNKAKYAVFELLKTKEGIEQVYDTTSKKIKLASK
ncbi:MAG: restriction endonuclease subunit S [Chitinophagales bacterium]